MASRGVSASNSAAENNRSGAPNKAAKSRIAGSSAFSEIVFTECTAASQTPASDRAERTRSASSCGGQLRAHPTPTVTRCGANCRWFEPKSACGAIAQVRRTVSPAGKSASQAALAFSSPKTAAPPPASKAAIAALASRRFTKAQPCGGSSKDTPKDTSPAVVTAAMPPKATAISRANRLAPWCPPNNGTTTAPSSDTEITGGSIVLLASNGDTARIKIPLAQTPTIGTPAANKSRAWSKALTKKASGCATRPSRPCS